MEPLEYDYDTNEVILNTTRKYDNEYAIPDGFSSPLNWAKKIMFRQTYGLCK